MKDLTFGEQTAIGKPIEEAVFTPENTQRITTNTRKPAITFARGDVDRQLPTFQMYGQVYLNPPLRNPLRQVAAIYNLIYEKAYNYQREHLNSWFSLHPQLALVKVAELETNSPLRGQIEGNVGADSTILTLDLTQSIVTPGLDVSDEWLRHNCKLLCSRLAERVALYDDAVTMLMASFANLCIAGKFEGTDGYFKGIASDFKWSRINNSSKNVRTFPIPKGLQEYIIGNSNYLSGVDNNGNPILVMPLWATDLWGNRGYHAPNMFSQVSPDGMMIANRANTSRLNVNSNLELRIAEIIAGYHGPDAPLDMRMPFIENGATLRVSQDNSSEAQIRLGMYGRFTERAMSKNLEGGDFSRAIWNNFQAWNDYITTYFSDFADVAGDWYKLVTSSELLGGYAVTPDLYKGWFQPISSGLQLKSLEDFMDHAKFGKSKRTSRCTILKMSPIDINGSTVDPSLIDQNFKDNVFVEKNFERFQVHDTDVSAILQRAHQWPTFTPVVTTGAVGDQASYFIGNVPPAPVKVYNNANSSLQGRSGLAYAERALYDFTRLQSIAHQDDAITTIGITSESAKDLVSGDSATKIFDEYRFYVSNDYLPLVDDSDPYACGINLFVSSDPGLRESLYAKIIKSPTNYLTPSGSENYSNVFDVPIGAFVETGAVLPFPELKQCPMDEVYDAAKSESGDWGGLVEDNIVPTYIKKAHIGNPDYMSARKYGLVFIGANYMTDPVRACFNVNAYEDAFYVELVHGRVLLDAINVYLGNEVDDASPERVLWTALRTSMIPNYGGRHNSQEVVLDMLKWLASGVPTQAMINKGAKVAITYLPSTCGKISINIEAKPFYNVQSPAEALDLSALYKASQSVVTRYAIGSPVFASFKWQTGTPYLKGWQGRQVDRKLNSLARSIWGISHYNIRTFFYDDMHMIILGTIYSSPTLTSIEDEILRMFSETEVKNMGAENFAFFWDAEASNESRYNSIDLSNVASLPELMGIVLPAPEREKILRAHKIFSPRKQDIRFKNASSRTRSVDIDSKRTTITSSSAGDTTRGDSSGEHYTSRKINKKARFNKRKSNDKVEREDVKHNEKAGEEYDPLPAQTPAERYDAQYPTAESMSKGKKVVDRSSKRAKPGFADAT